MLSKKVQINFELLICAPPTLFTISASQWVSQNFQSDSVQTKLASFLWIIDGAVCRTIESWRGGASYNLADVRFVTPSLREGMAWHSLAYVSLLIPLGHVHSDTNLDKVHIKHTNNTTRSPGSVFACEHSSPKFTGLRRTSSIQIPVLHTKERVKSSCLDLRTVSHVWAILSLFALIFPFSLVRSWPVNESKTKNIGGWTPEYIYKLQ